MPAHCGWWWLCQWTTGDVRPCNNLAVTHLSSCTGPPSMPTTVLLNFMHHSIHWAMDSLQLGMDSCDHHAFCPEKPYHHIRTSTRDHVIFYVSLCSTTPCRAIQTQITCFLYHTPPEKPICNHHSFVSFLIAYSSLGMSSPWIKHLSYNQQILHWCVNQAAVSTMYSAYTEHIIGCANLKQWQYMNWYHSRITLQCEALISSTSHHLQTDWSRTSALLTGTPRLRLQSCRNKNEFPSIGQRGECLLRCSPMDQTHPIQTTDIYITSKALAICEIPTKALHYTPTSFKTQCQNSIRVQLLTGKDSS
jgi:hypothetical protein